MKAKGQLDQIAKSEPLAFAFSLAGWQSGRTRLTVNRVTVLVSPSRGSNPLPASRLNPSRLKLELQPGLRNPQPKPYVSRKPSIRLLVVDRKGVPRVTCHNCRIEMVKAGRYGKNRIQRYKCQQCGKRFAEPHQKPFGEDVRLSAEKVAMILHCLVEGNSVRGTARLCDVEKRTVLNILKLAGERCERLLTEQIHNVPVRDLELDEVWTYVGCKQRRVTVQRLERGMMGDAWTFIALERTSKLVVAWHLGKRDRISTEDFVSKIRWATAPGWFDVSTDAFH